MEKHHMTPMYWYRPRYSATCLQHICSYFPADLPCFPVLLLKYPTWIMTAYIYFSLLLLLLLIFFLPLTHIMLFYLQREVKETAEYLFLWIWCKWSIWFCTNLSYPLLIHTLLFFTWILHPAFCHHIPLGGYCFSSPTPWFYTFSISNFWMLF